MKRAAAIACAAGRGRPAQRPAAHRIRQQHIASTRAACHCVAVAEREYSSTAGAARVGAHGASGKAAHQELAETARERKGESQRASHRHRWKGWFCRF